MRVLVTGANGFVGSHVVEALLAAGHMPVCLVRATANRRWLAGLPVEFRVGDIADAAALPQIVTGVDAVIHTAGVLRATTAHQYYAINQQATRNLAQATLDHANNRAKFVFISSQAALGPSAACCPKPADEPENPVSDYGKSKRAGEQELAGFAGRLPYTILRPASVYGPRDKDIFIFFSLVHYGFCPRPLKPRYIQLLFVKDLAAAAVAALTLPAASGKTYALADEAAYTWPAVASTIAQAVHKRLIPLPLPDTAFHIAGRCAELVAALKGQPAVLNRQKVAEMLQPYWLCDVSTARQELGLDFTKLANGAKITYHWYQENNWF